MIDVATDDAFLGDLLADPERSGTVRRVWVDLLEERGMDARVLRDDSGQLLVTAFGGVWWRAAGGSLRLGDVGGRPNVRCVRCPAVKSLSRRLGVWVCVWCWPDLWQDHERVTGRKVMR